MSDSDLSNTGVYPAVHDFSILPLSLGGSLLWSVRQCLKATIAGKSSMDVYLCADDHGPFNLFQQSYLHSQNYQVHLLEVLPAFFCNPMLRNLFLFTNRQAYNSALEQAGQSDPFAAGVIKDFEKLRSESGSREVVDKALIGIEGIHNFIEFHSEKGFLPKLVAPKGCDQHAAAFRKRIGEDRFIVTMQFRMGKLSSTRTEDSDLRENFSFNGWYEFMKLVERKFPDVRFIMLGKVPDMPVMCLRLRNVIIPRLCGFNLGHDLALLKTSNLFMGSHSGFAPMAMFSDVPYILTNVKEEGWWTAHQGLTQYPFATENQHLVHEPESVPLLLQYFGKIYGEWKKKREAKSYPVEFREEVRTNFLFGTGDEIEKELYEYVLEKVKSFANPNNTAATLASLDALGAEYSEITDKILLFHTARALALHQLKRLVEADQAISRAMEMDPLNKTVNDLNLQIQTALKSCETSK